MTRLAAILTLLLGSCATPAPPPSEMGGKYWRVEDPLSRAETRQPAPGDLDGLQVAAHLYRVSIQRDGETFAALWKGARTLCRIAEATPSVEIQASAASEALDYARRARRLEPLRVEAPYYLAVSAGLLAETRLPLEALRLVETIETEGIEAARLDPTFEQAAPLLLLGELYHKAPGPLGDMDLALEHLQEAVRLAPGHPPNRIALAELHLDEGSEEEAREVMAPVPVSLQGLSPRWVDRWRVLRERLGRP